MNLRPLFDETVFAAHVHYEMCRKALEDARSSHTTHNNKDTRKKFDSALAVCVAAEVAKNKAETEFSETVQKAARMRIENNG